VKGYRRGQDELARIEIWFLRCIAKPLAVEKKKGPCDRGGELGVTLNSEAGTGKRIKCLVDIRNAEGDARHRERRKSCKIVSRRVSGGKGKRIRGIQDALTTEAGNAVSGEEKKGFRKKRTKD